MAPAAPAAAKSVAPGGAAVYVLFIRSAGAPQRKVEFKGYSFGVRRVIACA